MLLTESAVIARLYAAGVRTSIRTLVVTGRLVRVVNRYGVHYLRSDVRTVIGGLA